MKNGLGLGQFFIGQKLVTGRYQLRAYTSWMRNFDEEYFFQKEITVINPFVSIPGQDSAMVSENCTFYPEGGDLVYGIESKVAFKVVDKSGKGINASGELRNRKGEVLANLKTEFNGIGTFSIEPTQGKEYSVRIDDGVGEPYEVELPEIKSEGLTMSVLHYPKDKRYDIKVSGHGIEDNRIYLLVQGRGILNYSRMQSLNDQRTKFEISEDQLSEGVNQMTLFDSKFEPQAERLIFKYPEGSNDINIKTSKTEYSSREKVSIDMNYNLSRGDVEDINLSLSVYRYYKDLDLEQNRITASLMLDSDLKGRIETPDYYFAEISNLTKAHLDNLMMTQGWRRFKWKDVLEDNQRKVSYYPELAGPILSGSSRPGNTNLKAIFPGKIPELLTSSIDGDGSFHIQLPYNAPSGDMLFYTNGDDLGSIELSPSFHSIRKAASPVFLVNKSTKPFIENYSTDVQISKVYQKYSQINGHSNKTLSAAREFPFYGQPDYTYNLDDYTRFKTMNEVFVEYIKYFRERVIDGRKSIYVWDMYMNLYSMSSSTFFHQPALTMIDGVPVDDLNLILDLNPLIVESIDIVARKFIAEDQSFAGVVNFITYNGDFGGLPLPDKVIRKLYNGLEASRQFYSPIYDDTIDLSRIPDYRKLLIWEPDVTLNSQKENSIEFFTSDVEGMYRIEVNGISESGTPVYGNAVLEVVTANKQ